MGAVKLGMPAHLSPDAAMLLGVFCRTVQVRCDRGHGPVRHGMPHAPQVGAQHLLPRLGRGRRHLYLHIQAARAPHSAIDRLGPAGRKERKDSGVRLSGGAGCRLYKPCKAPVASVGEELKHRRAVTNPPWRACWWRR